MRLPQSLAQSLTFHSDVGVEQDQAILRQQANEKRTLLRNVDLFAAVPDLILDELVERLDEVAVQPGEPIFVQDSYADAMYIVAEGQVRIHSGGRTLTILKAPSVFGEMGALAAEPRSANATAETALTRLFRLDRFALQQILTKHGSVAHGIIQILCYRLRARTTAMVDDYHYLQQVSRLTAAAAAVEEGIYTPESIDDITQRTDALGQLATVFQRMIREVYAREQRLHQQVQALRIEIDKARQAQQVEEITSTDYFQQLRLKARHLRTQLRKED